MRLLLSFLFLLMGSICFSQSVNIIPQPASLTNKKGSFNITRATTIVISDEGDRSSAEFLNKYMKQVYGFQLPVSKKQVKNSIRLNTKKFIKAPDTDAYSFESGKEGVSILGDTYAGTFYGIQTLLQLLPIQKSATLKIAAVSIQDEPRFSYRGMHLDAGRHFFSVDFVKRYIDYIALHKMNYFHWHLTDDQGWRIEIKKYPRLTEIGGWRNGTIIGRYPGTGNDGKRYGGYYTQEQIKDVVAYAASRYVTVVPEIEMPGHASAAIAAYPILSCFPNESTKHPEACAWSGDTTGKQVQQTWGVFEDVFCAGKETTFSFLQDVMDEVLPLFPSKLIHVGGDESPKENWKRCPQCQQRIRENGLKNEHELQSYFIQRMEKYLNSKGRNLIGWDEILEGGLAPNAAVMSWRGEEGGIEAAKLKHMVVMTPGGWVYFDHSQSQQEDSVTIGGYTPIEKTYGYEPQPSQLNAEEAKYIVGAQANLWSEYIQNPRKAEYMIFPRMSALSEVLWSPKDKRNWPNFEKRLQTQFKRYKLWKANYSKAYFDLQSSSLPLEGHNGVQWKLETKQVGATIKYQVHATGTAAPKSLKGKIYKEPVKISSSVAVTAWSASGATINGNPVTQEFRINKATGKNITLAYEPARNYPGDGPFTLVNGIQNERGLARSKEFLGFEGTDCEATIDLGGPIEVKEVTAHTFEQTGSWIYRPKSIEVLVSDDGSTFRSVGKSDQFIMVTPLLRVGVNFPVVKARFLKVIISNYGVIGAGNAGAGHKAWLFVSEIEAK